MTSEYKREYMRKYRIAHKAKLAEQNRLAYERRKAEGYYKLPERIEVVRAWKAANKDKCREYARNFARRHRLNVKHREIKAQPPVIPATKSWLI